MTSIGSGTGYVRPALPELLAPAGSPESFRAAIAAGADAVYLSGKRFGARKYAANFSDEEITEGIRLAHSRGVRVYVTVNTLIHDRELKGVADELVWLYAAGADAVLVQDSGVASLAREIVPDLPLHASTQMTIHNTGGVLWAAEQGFSRVVLARELPLEEIRTIAGEDPAERCRARGLRPRCALLQLFGPVPPLVSHWREEREPGHVRPALPEALYARDGQPGCLRKTGTDH